MRKVFVLILSIVFLFYGCDKSVVYNKTKKFDLLWNAKDIVSLQTNPVEPGSYQEVLVFRYGEGFQFAQLKIHLTTTENDNTLTDSDFFVNIIDKDGKYIGDGLGDIWDIEQPLDTIQVSENGTLNFQISQRVIDSGLPMVMEVGIKLRKLEQ